MPSVALTLFDQLADDLGRSIHDWRAAGDTLKVALSNTAPTDATDATFSDITEISGGNGYTAGGEDLQNDYSESGGVGTLVGTDVVWTASGGSIGPFRYVILYNDTPTSPQDPLIGYWDYGSAITVLAGGTFTLDLGASVLTVTNS